MAGTSITALQNLYNAAQDYYRQYDSWKQKLIDAQTLVTELERQKTFHEGNGDQANAELVSVRLTTAYNKSGEAKQNFDKYETLYKDASKAWEVAKSQLSPTEQKQLEAQTDADIAKAKADAAQSLVQSEADKNKLYMQKNTQYLIIAGVVVVVIVGVVIVWKKFF